jgi:O-antigen ligase
MPRVVRPVLTNFRQTSHAVPQLFSLLGGGLLIAAASAMMLSTLSWPLIAVLIAGMLTLLPTFVVTDTRFYWVAVYLFFLPLEAGKRITNLGQSGQDILTTIGLPPSGEMGIKLYPTDLALLAMILPWLVGVVAKKQRMYVPGYAYIFVAYLAWATLSAFLKSEYFAISVAQLVQEYKYFILYVFVVNAIESPKMIRKLLGLLCLVLFLEVAATLALHGLGYTRDSLLEAANLTSMREYAFLLDEEQSDSRAAGTLGSASGLAMYLQLLFAVPLTLSFATKVWWMRIGYLGLFILSTLSIYVSGSRSGSLGLVIGTIACILLCRARNLLSDRQLVSVFAASVILLVSVTISPAGRQTAYDFVTSRSENFVNRFGLMEDGLTLILSNPIFGVGPNNSTAARLESAVRGGSDDSAFPIHNHYLVQAAETGLVGFALYMLFFLAMVQDGVRRSRSPDPSIGSFSIAIVAGCLALSIQLVGDHFLGNAQRSMLFFYSGLIVALGRIEDRLASREADRIPAVPGLSRVRAETGPQPGTA